MRVGDHCKRGAVTIGATADVIEAARAMRDYHVGLLVVLDESGPKRAPLGVLSDRDIVVQVTARELDPKSLTVRDVMTSRPVTAREDDDVHDLLQGMRMAGIRRVPVIDAGGALVGMIAADDIVELLAELMQDLCGSIHREQRVEREHRGAG